VPKIVRVFRAEVKPGKESEFASFFLNDAIPPLRTYQGLVSIQVALPREETPREFSMITTWRNVESLIKFSGAKWRDAVIDPREEHLIARVNIDHYYHAPL